jgi:hypothetical protein
MTHRINWKLFAKESCILVGHALLAGFYFKVAQVLFDYYKLPIAGSLSLFVCFLFVLPLLIDFFDLWARTIASVREEKLAEKIFKCSITIHNTFFGKKNAYMSEKQAKLASMYYDQGKQAESEELFKESWKNYNDSAIKFPWLHPCFSDFLKILDTTGDTITAAKVKEELEKSRRLELSQKAIIALLSTPIISLLLVNQATEREIAKANAKGNIAFALNQISELANREAFFLGKYAAARVYTDYAQAFDDTEGQSKEMMWCAEKGLSALQSSSNNDEYIKVLLLNLVAKGNVTQGRFEDSVDSLEQSAAISSKWGAKELARNKNDGKFQRDKCIITLAEIKRNHGDYDGADSLYKLLLGAQGENINISASAAGCSFFDPIETIDRLHKFAHVKQKLGKREEALALQKRICDILETSVKGLSEKKANSPLVDFAVRETARELDVYAYMLQESGKDEQAQKYHDKADKLRVSRHKELKLDADQQDYVVDATTKLTGELLAVKYRAGDWHDSLDKLLKADFTSQHARGSIERLPWFDKNRKSLERIKTARPIRRLEIDIAPLSIRNNRDGEGLNVDVQGVVKIYNSNSKDADEQRFDFAYIMKEPKKGRPLVDDVLDNQILANYQLN